MSILSQETFYIKLFECVFGQIELEYLGLRICSESVKIDPHKITAIQSWPKPKNVSQLRGFLGLTDYYRKFVQHYGAIARLLTQLLKKDKFLWTEEADQVFATLKEAMKCTPILAIQILSSNSRFIPMPAT